VLFSIGTEIRVIRELWMKNLRIEEPDEIHNCLMKNCCPRCSQELQVIEKTEESLIRRCQACKLEIRDKMPEAEYPYE